MAAKASGRPIPNATSVRRALVRNIIRITSPGAAPSARRTPISFRRCSTAQENAPYTHQRQRQRHSGEPHHHERDEPHTGVHVADRLVGRLDADDSGIGKDAADQAAQRRDRACRILANANGELLVRPDGLTLAASEVVGERSEWTIEPAAIHVADDADHGQPGFTEVLPEFAANGVLAGPRRLASERLTTTRRGPVAVDVSRSSKTRPPIS